MTPVDGDDRTGGRGRVAFTDGIGFGGVGRSADWRAILPGVTVVAVVAAGAYLSSLPTPLAVLGPLAGGAVTGWLSRTFESEGYDGAMAALVGTMVAFVVALAVVWVRTTGVLVSTKLLVAASGLAVTVVFAALGAILGGIVAHATAVLRRSLQFVSDPVEIDEGSGGRR